MKYENAIDHLEACFENLQEGQFYSMEKQTIKQSNCLFLYVTDHLIENSLSLQNYAILISSPFNLVLITYVLGGPNVSFEVRRHKTYLVKIYVMYWSDSTVARAFTFHRV